MPVAERSQVNSSALRRAPYRRNVSGLLMILATARAMDSGSLSAAAPLSVVSELCQRGGVGHHRGCARRQRLQRRQPEGFVRAGRERDVGGGQDRRDGVAAADEAGERDRQPGGLPLQTRPHGAFAHHDELRIDT